MKLPLHDSRPGAIPIPAVFAPNGPGFQNLYAGDTVEFMYRTGELGNRELRRARVLQLLVFHDHVQVDFGSCGYTVNESNFVRLVRRGKRHIAADKQERARYLSCCPACRKLGKLCPPCKRREAQHTREQRDYARMQTLRRERQA